MEVHSVLEGAQMGLRGPKSLRVCAQGPRGGLSGPMGAHKSSKRPMGIHMVLEGAQVGLGGAKVP